MRQDLVAWVMVPVLWGQACWAQPVATLGPNDYKPASTNIIGLRYPQVNSARQVRFRIYEGLNGFNEKFKVFFLGAGGRKHQSDTNIWNLHKALAKTGIKSVYYESPGTAHERLTWRRHLREFAPLLF
jgi:S-formylglutathione hydrolase FrmB